MKVFTHKKIVALIVSSLFTCNMVMAGNGTKASPYTVAELNAQKESLATSGAIVWVKADLIGLGEDGNAIDNASTEDSEGKTVKHLAGVFKDDSGSFTAYSWQILGELAMSDLTNTKDLLIAVTYQSGSHYYISDSAFESYGYQYADSYEPEELHFSLVEIHHALSINIENGLRGYHIPCCYVVPDDVIAVKVSAGYSMNNGAYVNYNHFDGADETNYITSKNVGVVLMASNGIHDFVLTANHYTQSLTNGNALNPGTQAGINAGKTKNRARYRFVNDGTKAGFERNSTENCTVSLQSKDEVFLQVSSLDTNFMGYYDFENGDKNWIAWGGGRYSDFHDLSGIEQVETLYGQQPISIVFDLQGRQVTNPTKGLYIYKGKKIIIK